LFGRFNGTMAPSDFSPTCMLGVWLVAFPSRPELSPDMDEISQVPYKGRLHVHGVSDCAKFLLCKPLRRKDVAFSSTERDRHFGIRPVSQLNTQPVVSPVNASRRPSRDAAHHSGPGRLARPYPVEDLHLLSFASFSWRTPIRVKESPCVPDVVVGMAGSDSRPDACCRTSQTKEVCHAVLIERCSPRGT
jgi:hypothetical protein